MEAMTRSPNRVSYLQVAPLTLVLVVLHVEGGRKDERTAVEQPHGAWKRHAAGANVRFGKKGSIFQNKEQTTDIEHTI
jgi:hypothetical protein